MNMPGNIKLYLKRYRLLRNIVTAARSDTSMLRMELYRLWKSSFRSKSIRYYLQSHEVKKLHLGAGSNILEGWLNTDMSTQSDKVVYLDITDPLPFQDGTFDYIYSEHLLEHVSHEQGISHLKECYRVLRKNGRIRIATPDLQFLINLYTCKEKTEAQQRYIRWTVDKVFPLTGFYYEAFVLNNFFHHWGHQFIYDARTLEDALRRVGFEEILPVRVKKSEDPHLENLERHGNGISEEFNELQTMVFEAIRTH